MKLNEAIEYVVKTENVAVNYNEKSKEIFIVHYCPPDTGLEPDIVLDVNVYYSKDEGFSCGCEDNLSLEEFRLEHGYEMIEFTPMKPKGLVSVAGMEFVYALKAIKRYLIKEMH